MTKFDARTWAVMAVIAAACTGLGFGAAQLVKAPETTTTTAAIADPTYTVASGEVGEKRSITGTLHYEKDTVQGAFEGGLITRLGDPTPSRAPSFILALGERPVFAVPSDVPFYRDITIEAKGADVEALHRALKAAGVYRGSINAAWTQASQDAWVTFNQKQARIHKFVTDIPEPLRTNLIAVPKGATRYSTPKSLTVGKELEPGSPIIEVLEGEPTLFAQLRENHAEVFEQGQVGVMKTEGGDRPVVVEEITSKVPGASDDDAGPGDGGSMDVKVAIFATPQGSICGESCATEEFADGGLIRIEIQTTPPVEGAAVPVAALRRVSDTAVMLTKESGEQVPVEVLATDGGVAIVRGVEVGDVVKLPTPNNEDARTSGAGADQGTS